MQRKDGHRLKDVLDAIRRIDRYTAEGLPEQTRDHPVWDAILYNLAVIGEAINDISEETKARAPDVDWRAAVGMRNFIIHRYFATDLMVVASTLERDIPALRTAAEALIAELDSSSDE